VYVRGDNRRCRKNKRNRRSPSVGLRVWMTTMPSW
jgi:hypothetical protein